MSEFSTVIMSHDGRILEQLLIELGVKKGLLADKLNKSPNTVTNWMKRETLPYELLINIGKALRFDLTHKFPRLKQIPEASELQYFNEDPSDLLSVVNEIRGDYKKSEKQLADLEQQNSFLKDQINQLKDLIEAKNQIIAMKDETIRQLKKSQG